MADDITLNAGTGGDVVAADDIGGVKHQRVKVQYGADGSATDVSAAAPLPVSDADVLAAIEALGPLTDGQLRAAAIAVTLAAAENHVGQVGGHTPRVTGQLVRPGDATQYAIGDLIGNSQTAASVVPITFASVARVSEGSGRITAARCVVTAASGTIVLPKFDLILFRPATNIPFTAGSYPADNAALNVSAAAMKEIVGIFSFSDTAWRNQAGGATAAGDHVYQAVTIASGRLHAPFNLASLGSGSLLGLLQAQSTWNPGNVQNTFDLLLDVDQD